MFIRVSFAFVIVHTNRPLCYAMLCSGYNGSSRQKLIELNQYTSTAWRLFASTVRVPVAVDTGLLTGSEARKARARKQLVLYSLIS